MDISWVSTVLSVINFVFLEVIVVFFITLKIKSQKLRVVRMRSTYERQTGNKSVREYLPPNNAVVN